MKLIYTFAGFLSLLIGLIGVVTPVLPTTPFVLLSIWFLSKSHPQLVDRIKKNPLWAKDVSNWETKGAISKRAKIMASSLISISAISLYISHAPLGIKGAVLLILVGVLFFIWTRPSE